MSIFLKEGLREVDQGGRKRTRTARGESLFTPVVVGSLIQSAPEHALGLSRVPLANRREVTDVEIDVGFEDVEGRIQALEHNISGGGAVFPVVIIYGRQ